jgi:transposase
VRITTILARILALKQTRMPDVHLEPEGLVLDAAPTKLTDVQRTNRPLTRAYMLKERLARTLDGGQVNVARDQQRDWIGWAARSRPPPFRRVARTRKKHIEEIVAYCATRLNSGRSEGLNGKIRTITRRSFGFQLRPQPHHPPPPLLRRPHDLAGAQVSLTLPLNVEQTAISTEAP